MAISRHEVDEIEITQNYREVYKREKVLGGLIGFERLVKKDKVGGEELHIMTKNPPEKVFVNGKFI